MGGRKKCRKEKLKNIKKHVFPEEVFEEFDYSVKNIDPKEKSKLEKKRKKRQDRINRQEQIKDNNQGDLNDYGFHKVSAFVKDDVEIDKNFIISSIKNYVDDPFCGLGCFQSEGKIMFYFDANKEVAASIQSLSSKLQSPSGKLIKLKVEHVSEVSFILNCNQIEILKNVVFQRFNHSDGVLNLSSLHLDAQLVESNIFAPLSNKNILKQVITFIMEMKKQNSDFCVRAFDLSNNKLDDQSMKLLFLGHCYPLMALNLENNNIKGIKFLCLLSFFPQLEELKLLGNKFKSSKDRIIDKEVYVQEVRKYLPFLKILDGVDLDSPLDCPRTLTNSSNINSVHSLQSSSSSITEDNIKSFLEQYYSLFDTSNRSTLLQAYVPTAKIELKSQNPLVPNKIFEGQIAIQEFLNSWPLLKHDHSSFSLEILKLSPEEGISQVQGVCMVVEPQVSLKFKRIMKIVPYNTGFCCVEDALFIL